MYVEHTLYIGRNGNVYHNIYNDKSEEPTNKKVTLTAEWVVTSFFGVIIIIIYSLHYDAIFNIGNSNAITTSLATYTTITTL